MQRIHISIAFGDAILPVVKCEDGHDRVPLKPISDQVGVNWKGQKRKLTNDDYLTERFGLILGVVHYPQMADMARKRDEYLIRLDRITAFLNTLNPHLITVRGNSDAADWLKDKHNEWDNALHSYETNGFAAKVAGADLRDALCKLDKIKNPDIKSRFARSVNEDFDTDLKIAVQLDLVD
mgnify:CR=1 FL=1